MISLLRNFAIALGASISALIVGAGMQELFVRLVPSSRAILLGAIDIGSWLGFATVFFSFALASVIQTRWIRSDAGLFWALFGPLGFLVAAILQGLNVFGCLRHWTMLSHTARVSCAMITVLLLSPLLGALTALLALRLWQHFTARRQITPPQTPPA